MSKTKLGRMQLKIMRVLWRRGRANAREITKQLSAEESVAHSTVQTLLRKLEEKGSVAHDVEQRMGVRASVRKISDRQIERQRWKADTAIRLRGKSNMRTSAPRRTSIQNVSKIRV